MKNINKMPKYQKIATVLITIGVVILIDVAFHYYDTPLGYGNHDGLMASIFSIVAAIPVTVGILFIILHSLFKKTARK